MPARVEIRRRLRNVTDCYVMREERVQAGLPRCERTDDRGVKRGNLPQSMNAAISPTGEFRPYRAAREPLDCFLQ